MLDLNSLKPEGGSWGEGVERRIVERDRGAGWDEGCFLCGKVLMDSCFVEFTGKKNDIKTQSPT